MANDTPGDVFNVTTYYKLVLDHLEVADFESVSGLNANIEVTEYQEGGENAFTHKLLGPARFSNVTLRRGTSSSSDLWDWIDKCIKGQIERKGGSITALARDSDTPVCTWTFFEAFPCAYRGPDFNSRQGVDLAIEELELAFSRFEFRKD